MEHKIETKKKLEKLNI